PVDERREVTPGAARQAVGVLTLQAARTAMSVLLRPMSEVSRHLRNNHIVVDPLGAPGSLSSGLHRRQQERDQNRDDRNHHQKLDERDPSRSPPSAPEFTHVSLPNS